MDSGSSTFSFGNQQSGSTSNSSDKEKPRGIFAPQKQNLADQGGAPSNQFNNSGFGRPTVSSNLNTFGNRPQPNGGFFTQNSRTTDLAPTPPLFGSNQVFSQFPYSTTRSQDTPQKPFVPKSSPFIPGKNAAEGPTNPAPAIAFFREPRMFKTARPIIYDNREQASHKRTTSELPVKQEATKEHSVTKLPVKDSSIKKHGKATSTDQLFTTNPPIGLDPTHICFVCERPFFDPGQPRKSAPSKWSVVRTSIDRIVAFIFWILIVTALMYPDEARKVRDVAVDSMNDGIGGITREARAYTKDMVFSVDKATALLSMLWLAMLRLVGR